MAANMSNEQIEILEKRLEDLERRILSKKLQTSIDDSLMKKLVRVKKQLAEAENNSPDIKKVFSQIDKIKENCELCHSDALELPEQSKIHYIEASQSQIEEHAKKLEVIQKLTPVLDSEHLKSKVGSAMYLELSKLYQTNDKLQSDSDLSLQQTKQLVDAYNQAISAVSDKFEEMNRTVTRLEQQQIKVLD